MSGYGGSWLTGLSGYGTWAMLALLLLCHNTVYTASLIALRNNLAPHV